MALSTPVGTPRDLTGSPASRSTTGNFTINTLRTSDLGDVLRLGWRDFMAMPSHLVFLVAVYPAAAFMLAQLTYSLDMLPMFFPLVAGFAILGPFVGLLLYEISRRRELGLEPRWHDALKVFDSPSRGSFFFIALMLLAIFAAWLVAAARLYTGIMGVTAHDSVGSFLSAVLTTSEGWTLIVVGHAVGFLFAALAFVISVVSFPLLVDRPVGASEAIRASILTVVRNPAVMALWAATIAAGLMAGSALLFVGLVIVLPVFAHASWHLYRRAVTWT
ncbi:MAG: DUF2189 domain-containing protein [Beijerinckiaceae bacterium]